MSRHAMLPVAIAAILSLAAAFHSAAAETDADADGDGISDRQEAVLGTDLAVADGLQGIVDDGIEPAQRRRETYDATKDVVRVEFASVGGDRYLWRVTLADRPRLEDTVLHLYVDADADEATGRKGPPGVASTGTEHMLTVAGGRASNTCYRADGQSSSGVPVSFAVDGNTVLMSADIDLARDDRGLRYHLYVLCHTLTDGKQPASMSDATPKQLIAGVAPSGRKKILRLGDYQANHAVSATFGEDLLHRVLTAEGTVAVPHDRLETDGMAVDLQTSQRWPHLKLEADAGKAWTSAPAGRYHAGFMMYDDGNREQVGLVVDGRLRGVAVAAEDNNRTWMYWLDEACTFQGGERVELRTAGRGGKYGFINILFLPDPPEERPVRYEARMLAPPKVDEQGHVTLAWTTTWPCATRFEYGSDGGYGTLVESEGACLAHRVVLEGLDPAVTYTGRAIGTARDGSTFFSDPIAIHARPATPPRVAQGARSVPLVVRNTYPFAVERWPITTGVPMPQGRLAGAEGVQLLERGQPVPAQVQVTARWLDGSVKWLLVNFQATAPAAGETVYELRYGPPEAPSNERAGSSPARAADDSKLAVRSTDLGVTVDTGVLRFAIDGHGNLADVVRADGQPAFLPEQTTCTTARDVAGNCYSSASGEAEVAVEESGPERAVVKVVSHLADGGGQTLLRIEKRVEAWRGLASLRIQHTLVVDRPDLFTELKELTFHVPVATAGSTWTLPLADGNALELNAERSAACQRFDDELVTLAGSGESPVKARAVGAIYSGGEGGCALAVRDFWQNYPKAFALRPEGIDVGLCPALAEGLYDAFPFEREGHQLYYYLLGGRYRFKRGMAKTHDLFLAFEPSPRREQLCRVFQRPLLATAPPEWYCGSKAFYDVAPRDPARFPRYEEAIDKNLAAYAAQRERQRDYGLMNYGDWYGERGTNWGNIEYDTQHALFLEYIRSGNPEAFFLGEAAELHNRDVDTLHWSAQPHEIGAVYVHQMGHVGDYYDQSVPGSLGFPHGGYTVSHAWVEGHFDHYFLTGDRRSYETGCAVADYFIRKELGRPYDFLSCRTPGWHLIMLASAYAATSDPYYLAAANVVAERVLDAQDQTPRPLPEYQAAGRKPYQQGGWSRMMVPGHCQCEPRHRGNAGFMVAVLLSGLKYYHDVTGDPRAKQSIIAGANYLLDETYSDEVKGFRYTSCPNTTYSPGATPLMVEGIARAYLWTGDERFRRVLAESLPLGARGSGYGKGFSMYYRCAPRVLADLAAAGLTLE